MISPEFWYLFPCVSLPPSLPFFLLHRLKAGLKKKSKLQPKSSSKRELDKYYDMVLVSLGKYQATETNWTSIPHSSFHRLHSNDTILASHKYTLSVAQPSAYIIYYHHDLCYDCDIIIPIYVLLWQHYDIVDIHEICTQTPISCDHMFECWWFV